MPRVMSNDPLLKYKYVVSIPGLPSGMGFNKVSALKKELGVVEYNEGGYSNTHKLVGKEKVEAVTLERGMFAGKELENLYKKSLSNIFTESSCIRSGLNLLASSTVTQVHLSRVPANIG